MTSPYEIFNSVSCYLIGEDRWVAGIPVLQVARHSAASCCISDYVFVFAGMSLDSGRRAKRLCSLERINVPAIARCGAVWELI